jgi:hypothetical protein
VGTPYSYVQLPPALPVAAERIYIPDPCHLLYCSYAIEVLACCEEESGRLTFPLTIECFPSPFWIRRNNDTFD